MKYKTSWRNSCSLSDHIAQLMATERKETNTSFCRSNSFDSSEVYLPERSWRIYFTVVCLTFRRALYGTSKRGRDFVRGKRRRDGELGIPSRPG